MKFIFLFALVALCNAAVLNEILYTKGDRTDQSTMKSVTLWVKLDSAAATKCHNMLMERSNPGPKFLKHLTFDEMAQFSSLEHVEAAEKVLKQLSADFDIARAPNLEYLTVTASVAEFEKAFNAEFYDYSLRFNTNFVLSAADFELPTELSSHLDVATGLNTLPRLTQKLAPIMRETSKRDVEQSKNIATPQLIWKTYGINNRTIADYRSTSDLFGSLGQDFSPADLAAFQKAYNLPNTPISQVSGPNNPQNCLSNPNNCVEANLDVQQMTQLAQKANVSFWSIPTAVGDIFLDWIQAIASDPKPPFVHSISYGGSGPEGNITDEVRFNTEVCKMGLRGLTVLVSSGDDGVAGSAARNDPSQCGFTPSFPATSQYVLAVGATQGPESGQPEIACDSSTGGGITTGGGFSDVFSRPSWQDSAVKYYLQNAPKLPPSYMFNTSGRGYPDVAFLGHNFPVEVGGSMYGVDGTSASSPCFAGVITLINGLRLAQGKSTIGFLNPYLYSTLGQTSAFNKISSGRNNCCAGGKVCCKYGFSEMSNGGWSPLTGFGSPNFPVLSQALLKL